MRRFVLILSALGALAACGPDAPTGGAAQDDTDGLAAASDSLTAANDEGVWFPLEAGNRWTFEAPGATRTVSITGVNGLVARVEGLFDAPRWVAGSKTAPNTLLLWNDGARRWEPFVRFGYAATPWQLGEGCAGLALHRAATGTVVTGKAGTFGDTRVMAVSLLDGAGTDCAAPAFTELTFAARVGLVAFRSGRGERFVLASAVVSGTLWPLTTGTVRGALSLDQPSYTNVPNTAQCATAPCASNARTAAAAVTFTVSNSTEQTLTWNFATACQFDLDVASVTGEVVRRLSDGRFCTQAPTQLTLGPGEVKVYTASLSLEDRDGLQLDGSFTLSARLLGPDGPKPTASLPLEVTIR